MYKEFCLKYYNINVESNISLEGIGASICIEDF